MRGSPGWFTIPASPDKLRTILRGLATGTREKARGFKSPPLLEGEGLSKFTW